MSLNLVYIIIIIIIIVNNDDALYIIENSHYKVYNAKLNQMYGYSKETKQYDLEFKFKNVTVIVVNAMNYTRRIFYLSDDLMLLDGIDDDIKITEVDDRVEYIIGNGEATEPVYCYTEACDFIGFLEVDNWTRFYIQNGFRAVKKEDVRKNIDADMKEIRKNVRNYYKSKLRNKRLLNNNIEKHLSDDIGYYYEERDNNNNIFYCSYIIESNKVTIMSYKVGNVIESIIKTIYTIPADNKITTINYDTTLSTFEATSKTYNTCKTPTLLMYILTKSYIIII